MVPAITRTCLDLPEKALAFEKSLDLMTPFLVISRKGDLSDDRGSQTSSAFDLGLVFFSWTLRRSADGCEPCLIHGCPPTSHHLPLDPGLLLLLSLDGGSASFDQGILNGSDGLGWKHRSLPLLKWISPSFGNFHCWFRRCFCLALAISPRLHPDLKGRNP